MHLNLHAVNYKYLKELTILFVGEKELANQLVQADPLEKYLN